MGQKRLKARKAVFILLGLIFLIPGLVVSISPVPLGFVLLLPGVTFLIIGSRQFRRWIRRRRERNAEINARIITAEDSLPGPIADPLKLTRPREHDGNLIREQNYQGS
ncbi:hypothetical protein [Parvularcula marina]|uniref:hypothetical protein n=1 Tax=Parvularcula marina TaxID=2292771 RepID=UPI00351600CC